MPLSSSLEAIVPFGGNNQSASWFKESGFSQMLAHVNFPDRTATWLDGISLWSN